MFYFFYNLCYMPDSSLLYMYMCISQTNKLYREFTARMVGAKKMPGNHTNTPCFWNQHNDIT
jgi:hypothetical protein